jgi:hypothetical protein
MSVMHGRANGKVQRVRDNAAQNPLASHTILRALIPSFEFSAKKETTSWVASTSPSVISTTASAQTKREIWHKVLPFFWP